MDKSLNIGVVPFDSAVLLSTFGQYKSPKDKVARMVNQGEMLRLKKGLFVLSPEVAGQPLSLELIANHLYTPSYVSFETALAFWGIIPERVYTVRSATMKRGRTFSNELGVFEYVQTDPDYFSIGVRSNIVNGKYAYLIASPEKALCDMIVASKRLRLQSVKAMREYLLEDLRIDIASLEAMDITIVEQCIATAIKKKNELRQLCNFLQS